MPIITIAMRSADYKAWQAEEATWSAIDLNNLPKDYVEFRFYDGNTDFGFNDWFDMSEVCEFRPVDKETYDLHCVTIVPLIKHLAGV